MISKRGKKYLDKKRRIGKVTIEEIRERKKKLEETFLDLWCCFEKETGVKITNIHRMRSGAVVGLKDGPTVYISISCEL